MRLLCVCVCCVCAVCVCVSCVCVMDCVCALPRCAPFQSVLQVHGGPHDGRCAIGLGSNKERREQGATLRPCFFYVRFAPCSAGKARHSSPRRCSCAQAQTEPTGLYTLTALHIRNNDLGDGGVKVLGRFDQLERECSAQGENPCAIRVACCCAGHRVRK